MSPSLITGYQGDPTDDGLDRIIRVQALVSPINLIGRTRVGIIWRVLPALGWFVAGVVAVIVGRHASALGAGLAFAWSLPIALANLRLARR